MVFLKTPQLRELRDSTVFFFPERLLAEDDESGARDADEERYVQHCWGAPAGAQAQSRLQQHNENVSAVALKCPTGDLEEVTRFTLDTARAKAGS